MSALRLGVNALFYLPGDVGADRGDGPGALQAAAGVAHGGQQVSLGGTGPGVLDEVGDDL